MFSAKVKRRLQSYVYAYVDPRDGRHFYIGHGKGDRAFNHMKEIGDSNKQRTIADIVRAGLKPQIIILRHGLTQEEAKIVESVCIDLLGIENLTNEIKGKYARTFGACAVEELVRRYDAPPAKVSEPCIAINLNKTYRYGMSERELYECTRGVWVVGKKKGCASFALAVYQGVILEAYRIEAWLPAGSVYSERSHEPSDRYEFVGNIDRSLSAKYKGLSLQSFRNPIRYINCERSNNSLQRTALTGRR